MTHLESCPRCDEREAAHLVTARRFRALHWQLVRLSWRYARLRLQNRKLIRENHRLLTLLAMQQERMEVEV